MFYFRKKTFLSFSIRPIAIEGRYQNVYPDRQSVKPEQLTEGSNLRSVKLQKVIQLHFVQARSYLVIKAILLSGAICRRLSSLNV